MIILGIDPGTARLGYALVDFSTPSPKLLTTDVIITTQDLDMKDRLKFIYKALHETVSAHNPSIMVLEKLFFNTNAKTAIAVGQARGVALLIAADKALDVYEYTALEAKKVVAGYGRASKKEMQEAVQKSLGLDNIVKSDDANDAVAMALCFYYKTYVNPTTE